MRKTIVSLMLACAGQVFAGGVMPQKSTDFYPKLLSGMVMYKLD